ncbi:Uncharacterized protein APZ42_018313 [Daphnia magna]|uniref:Uncharacterized protein n=1 Tax=Daphnia magna TaxID=35525 RepID=A0A162CQQ3_9CRUS|nr:Uncharacterized protein APZ42_018313 [Daphnia magna]
MPTPPLILPPQTSTDVQSIPPPRCDDVQVRETISTSTTAAALKNSALLTLEKFSYADIAAGRRSPSVSRQTTFESHAELVEPVSEPVQIDVVEPPVKLAIEIQVPQIQETLPGRSRWEQQQQEKLVQSDDPAAETKHPSRSDLRRRAAGGKQKRSIDQESNKHGSQERHPPVTPAESFDVQVQEEPVIEETKMVQEAVQETGTRPKVATTERRSSSNLSPPSDSEKRSRSPLWMPGSGGPSYADILRGHYIPHHQRGMTGIVDSPQQQQQQQEQLRRYGGDSIDETNMADEVVVPAEDTQQTALPEVIEESSPVTQVPEQTQLTDATWVPHQHAVYDEPIQQQQQQIGYPESMFQPSNLSFENQYASAPDAEAVFAANFDLMALQQAYAQLEYGNLPVAYPLAAFPIQQTVNVPQNFTFNVEQPRQEFTTSNPTLTAPQIQEPEAQVIAATPVQQTADAPVEVTKPVATNVVKLSYAQILAAGLRDPAESPHRRDSSGSAGSGCTSSSPRPSQNTIPVVSDKAATDSAPSPSRLSVPERGVSEPREPRSRQRISKGSKSKSFDVREKDPSSSSKPKSPHGASKLATLPGRSMEAKTRPKKKARNASFNEDKEWTPVSVQVSPPPQETLMPPEPSQARSKSPGGNPPNSEPEMTKAMMTFYGISSEDIEQLISSRSQDSDSDAEVAGVEATTEKKKKHLQKKKKRKSSKVPDEDEIEKALREISELERTKKSKMRRTPSHEMKSSIAEAPVQKAQKVQSINLEVPEPKKRDKKLKKAASVGGGHPDKSNVKPDSSPQPLTEASTGCDSATSSSGSPDPSAHKQRRDRIKRAKTVSFNEESLNKCGPAPVTECQVNKEEAIPKAETALENEAEFVVLNSQGLESVGHLVADVESLMEDAMSDDIVVLETENLATSPGPIEGHRTLDPQILEDVFTETTAVFESHVCPEIYEEEEECVPVVDDQLKEESISSPTEPVADADRMEKEIPASEGASGLLNVAEENNDDKITIETTEELPLGSQSAAAMTLLPLEVRVTLRKISATSTVPFQPEELELRADDTSAKDQQLRATESIDLEPAALEITSAMIFNNSDSETVGELEQDTESPVLNAETAGIDILTCISAVTHSPPVEMITVEQLPILARQVSLADEEYADESELSLPPSTTPIPAMQEREEEALTLATMEEPPTTKMYVPAVEQELPSQEQMVDIVEALLEEPEEPVIETPATVRFSVAVEAQPTEPFPAENSTEVSAHPTTAGTTQSTIISVPLLTETPPDAGSVSSPGSDYKAPSSPFGFDDADHVVLSPQWMRQRSPLGRTFSLDPRNLSTALKSTPASPLVKAHSTDLSESFGTEEQKAAAAKSLEEGSKSESQTGGEADDEDVEVYWRLREKKKKKKRRNPITAVAGNPLGPRVSESSSDALSMAEPHGPMSPLSVGSDLPVSESTLTSDDEHRTKCTQDDGFQSGISTPILLSVASPDSELPETPTELLAETESVSVALTETLGANSPITAEVALPSEDIDTLSQSTLQEEDVETEVLEKVESEANEIVTDMPILAGPCLLMAPETAEELQQQISPTTEEVELKDLKQTTPAFEESSVSFDSPDNECLEPINEPEAISVPANQATSWANLVATGKPKISEPTPEPEPAPRPPRPLPTLIVVGEEEHHDVPCDPEGFHIGRKERKWRKWRSSQSESQDVASDTEHVETPLEAPLPSTAELAVEEIVAVKQVPPPSPAEISSSESDQEMAEPIRVVVRSKVQKMAKSVRELEQRKRRSRLSESEQEVLELAEAIAANRSIPSVRPQKDDHLRNIYLDSWPKCSASALDNSEKCLWILQQSSGHTTEATDDVPETVDLQSDELVPIEENIGGTEAILSAETQVLETGENEPSQTVEKDMEQTQLIELEKNLETVELCQEVEEQVETVVQPDETTEREEIPRVVEDSEKETIKEEPCHPSVISWATVVATSKPIITETKEDEEEPVRPKRPLPTLIVVGESEQPVAVQTDPDSFTEFVCRSERRRRKWRSSQSESQDYTTDEEHVETVSLAVKDKPEEQTVASEPVETIAEHPVILLSTDVVKEKESDEEEVPDVPSARPKERQTKTPKASIPLKETEQRRRRARLSESEKESLDLAEAIEHGDPIPVLYQNLHADSWPQHTTSTSENLWAALQQSPQTTGTSDAIPEIAEVESIQSEPTQLMESKLPDLESLLVAPEQSPETTDPIPEVAEVESIQSEPSQVTESTLPNSENLSEILQESAQTIEASDVIPPVAGIESIQSEPTQTVESTLPNSENMVVATEQPLQTTEASDAIPKVESIQNESSQVTESKLPDLENLLVALEQSPETTEASDSIPEVAEVESIQSEPSQIIESNPPNSENLLVASDQSQTTETSDAIPEMAEHQSIQGEPSQVMDECNLVPAEALTEPVELDLQLENESIVQSETIEDIVQQVDEPPKEPVESKHPSVLSWASVVATSKPAITESKEEVVEEPVRPKRPLPTLIVVGDGEQPVPVETDPDSFTEFVCRNERRRRKWRSSQSESQDYTTDEEHVESVSLVVDDKPKEQLVDSEPVEAPVQAPVTSAPIKLVEDVSDEEVHDVLPARPKERKTKTAKVSIPLKETEQRRRRARLSESERESLELADVIEHGETTPQLYYDLFADSWPHPFYIFLRDAESRWKAKESLVNQSVVTNVQEPIQEASQLVPQETVCEPQEQVDCQPNQEPTPELIPESVQEWVPEPSALQEEASSCPSAEVLQPTTDETPVISGWVIRESPEKKVPEVAKPLSWAAMVALSKAAAMETVPEPVVEQVAPRPTKTPVLVVVGEEVQSEPISSDDPDGFHECVSRREKRRRKWRSSQSESQDTEAEAVVPEASFPTDLPSEPSYVNVKVENVSTHPPELHEKSESKSKRVVVKIEKQTKEVERKRSKRLSESEREALQLAEAIESGQDITNKCPVVESYWSDKILYSDAEKLWQESLNGAAVRLDDKIESLKQSQSPESDPIPQPPPSVESSNSSSRLPTTTENINNIDLPEDRAIWSDESTFLSESQEERQQNVHKKDLFTDLDAMLAQLQQVEKDLQQFNSQQIQDRLPLIEAVMESLEEMEPRLIDLDDRIKNLSDEDPELDSIRAAVASLRTRHITLESQACRYKQKLEDAAEAKSKDNEDLLRYQALLSDLDDWVSVTHGQLKAELPKFTSVGAVLKEMDSSKRLEQDIVKRNEQLADLMKRCGTLQDSVAETEPLATQLYEHLCVLQRSFSEAGAQLHTRLLLLQV